MSWMHRFANQFRQRRVNDEIAEETAAHWEEALEHGRSSAEVRKKFGSELHYRELSRDQKLLPWVDSLASDIVFGWRQLRKRPTVSAAAILSLGLAIGATTAAFRLINAVILRTLPVADPQNLFVAATTYLDHEGHPQWRDDFDYPTYREYSRAVADRADLIVAGNVRPREIDGWDANSEVEPVHLEYVSGNFFPALGLNPSYGRLFTADDDRTPGGHPVAVVSYDYWTRRFHRDPATIGRKFRGGSVVYTVIGVAPKGFIGTEPGATPDIYLPAMMNVDVNDLPGVSWFRMLIRPKPGYSVEQVHQPLAALFRHNQLNDVNGRSGSMPESTRAAILSQQLLVRRAATGASAIQKDYRRPLLILAGLIALVLLTACANVGNLLTAQATARAREMALRVSIGAGQWRLIQLVLVESALLAIIASALGTIFASWSAPLVVTMLRVPQDPVQLVLDAGWREVAFGAALAAFVTLLFGLSPALRASNVKPMSALRGGEDPHSRRRTMNVLLAAQMAFCVLVLFVAGLFVSTFQRLTTRSLGFAPDRLLLLNAKSPQRQTPQVWEQAIDALRAVPGVKSVAVAGWPLLEGDHFSLAVRLPGQTMSETLSYALEVSPGYFDTMGIERLDGRDLRSGDTAPTVSPSKQGVGGVGVVNESFARVYFGGENPVGRTVNLILKQQAVPLEIVGYVRDTVYADIHDPVHPIVFFPSQPVPSRAILVRTSGDSSAVIPSLRRAANDLPGDIRVRIIQPQSNLILWQTLRERLLATLSLFFAIVAMVLSAIGLYGVLNYSVTWQRRELGIRMALGANSLQIVRRATSGLLGMMIVGLAAGLVAGVACGRFVQSLLFGVEATDPLMIGGALATLLVAGALAALPPAIRATRIDPANTLRAE